MATAQDVSFSCACGSLKGTLLGVTHSVGTHAECFCIDCRAGELYCKRPDPAPGGVGIFQTTPDRIRIEKGQEHLAVFSFGPKNILRWYAACCEAPLFNTGRSPKFAFVGVRTNRLHDTDPLGPVVGRAFVPNPKGKPRHEGFAKFLWGVISRVTVQRLTGRWKNTPFFDPKSGVPLRPVKVVPKAERAALKASTT